MKIAYFDCFAGASGDMILGALLDAGLAREAFLRRLQDLGFQGCDLRVKEVVKGGLRATRVEVVVADEVHERRLPEIEAIVKQSLLPEAIKEKAIAIFRRLGEVEAGIHGTTPDKVHLHELGGLDTLVDVIGTIAGLAALGVERVYASPLPLGRGFSRSAHGQLPLPAPATLALLEGVPVVGSDLEVELVTPTGAALLTSLAESFGTIPAMRLRSIGYGAGSWELPFPNVLRLLIGEMATPGSAVTETLVCLETNLDDLNPEIYDYVMSRLFAAGALDVFLVPIQMKKNRPATLLSVLCRPGDAEAMSDILFSETSTLGVRKYAVERRALERQIDIVETPYGQVRVKVARWGEGQVKWAPEYEDCRRLAEEKGVPLREIYLSLEKRRFSP